MQNDLPSHSAAFSDPNQIIHRLPIISHKIHKLEMIQWSIEQNVSVDLFLKFWIVHSKSLFPHKIYVHFVKLLFVVAMLHLIYIFLIQMPVTLDINQAIFTFILNGNHIEVTSDLPNKIYRILSWKQLLPVPYNPSNCLYLFLSMGRLVSKMIIITPHSLSPCSCNLDNPVKRTRRRNYDM